MRKKKSILFVNPDYHCSFFYRDEFRKQGWNADIYVAENYPENLLYSKEDILRPFYLNWNLKIGKIALNKLIMFFWWHTKFWKYDVHFYYGNSPVIELGSVFEQVFPFFKHIGKEFSWEFWIARLFGVKLIYVPTGCLDSDLKSTFKTYDEGNVCNNCGFFDRCDDKVNKIKLGYIRKYFEFAIGGDSKISKALTEKTIKYKVIDLDLWKPEIVIPKEYLLSPTKNLRILHSSFLDKSGRKWNKRNIKGSSYVFAAVEQLKSEGYAVEYFYITDVPSNKMRFYQAQADIVVEQLIYGWWGSTGVETMALGKPVVCYLRPSWKTNFLNVYEEYDDIPIIQADTQSIYDSLKKLVVDEDYRKQKGIESRFFAEKHFNPIENTQALIHALECL